MNKKTLDQLIIELHQKSLSVPKTTCSESDIITFITNCQQLLFPGYFENTKKNKKNTAIKIKALTSFLNKSIPKLSTEEFISKLIQINQTLQSDIDAIFAGDPAAKDKNEIILSYPGFYAIFVYRIANYLHKKNVPLIPRRLTEIAHQKTGIDIHPGATIDHSFCIDHGSGLVIGETAIIGHHVKLYQGVTLGAFSTKEKKDKKRHPTIKNFVTIYARSTILGGETIIGENVVIGGNTWITKSIPKNTTIYVSQDALQKQKSHD